MKHAWSRFSVFLACAGCGGADFSAQASPDAGDELAVDVAATDGSAPDARDVATLDVGDVADVGDAGDELDAPGDVVTVDVAPHDAGLCCDTKSDPPTPCNSGGFDTVYTCVVGFFSDADPDRELCSPSCKLGQWCQLSGVIDPNAPMGTVQPCP
jgi:hypothetical protein